MRVLMTGDTMARAGRRVLEERLQDLRTESEIDFVVSNVENAAAGFSITPRIAEDLFAAGVDVMTSGNHIFDKKEILEYIEGEPRLLRPANYAPGVPGRGRWTGRIKGVAAAVINLQGRVFMPPSDDPFRAADAQLAGLDGLTKIILVDMHAETTSEKMAMGRYLDGRVSAVVGTHTHVQTADEQILPGGTAYLTDLGMTGPHDGVIGMQTEIVIERFLRGLAPKFEPSNGAVRLNGLLIDIDELTGHAERVERISLPHS
ncbi:MAG: TIGR00282 family metallophosphoesterase [Acidobacteriota bacterium]|nr:MAG: TIGR00282 family metallophosphoesterase [Acidobacteriota bacterium]